MKKLILAGALAFAGMVSAQTTGLRIGAHAGIITGSASDYYTANVGADVAYLFPVSPEFNLGIASGYSAYIGKSTNVLGTSISMPTVSLIPVAAAVEFKVNPQFTIGADLGYGYVNYGKIGNIEIGSAGGFYYQPKVAYNFGPSMVYLSYKGVSASKDNGKNTFTASPSSVNLGFAYGF